MSDDNVPLFAQELKDLISAYQFKLNNAEVLGVMKIAADEISQIVRNEWRGPSEFS